MLTHLEIRVIQQLLTEAVKSGNATDFLKLAIQNMDNSQVVVTVSLVTKLQDFLIEAY